LVFRGPASLDFDVRGDIDEIEEDPSQAVETVEIIKSDCDLEKQMVEMNMMRSEWRSNVEEVKRGTVEARRLLLGTLTRKVGGSE
jgi:hypothetical protein